jgi:hypothetical protein
LHEQLEFILDVLGKSVLLRHERKERALLRCRDGERKQEGAKSREKRVESRE